MKWPTVALEDLASVQRGKFSARPRNDPRYYGGQIPFIQTGDVAKSNGRVSSYSQTLNADGLSVSKLFPKGSLAITIAANIGDVAQVDFDFACPDSLVVVRAGEGVNVSWLRYCIAAKKPMLESLAPQNAQKNINLEMLRPLALDVPPFQEQRRIAEIIETWESAIEKTEQLIAVKGTHLKAIEHQLLTARQRINGFSSKRESLRADQIFESTSLKGFGSEPLLSVTQDQGVVPRNMLTGRVTMPSGDTTSFKLVEPGNFVISLRSFQGGLEYSNYRGLVSPAYTVLRATREIDERYFRHYFCSADFIKRLSVAVIGIRDGKQVSFQDFCSIKIPFPPVAEQQAIATVLDEAENEIALLRNQIAAFKKQKRGLMQKLLTGQWRVPMESNEVVA